MKDFSKVGIALLAGIAAGAVAGLLLAPEEGAETRKKLAKKAKKYEDKLKEKAQDFKAKAGEYMGKASDMAGDVKKTAEGYL
jgi:gas vesicle protein